MISLCCQLAVLLFLCLLLLVVECRRMEVERRPLDPYADSPSDLFSFDFYCYSCASPSYLSVWNNQLMGHYFPPKNFTDQCWKPNLDVGVVTCSSACFTLVEEINDRTETREAVMRGCVDRFLLFGLDADIKRAIAGFTDRSCRTVDRHLLNMVTLSPDLPLVLICSCIGNVCNSDELANSGVRSFPQIFLFLVFLIFWKKL